MFGWLPPSCLPSLGGRRARRALSQAGPGNSLEHAVAAAELDNEVLLLVAQWAGNGGVPFHEGNHPVGLPGSECFANLLVENEVALFLERCKGGQCMLTAGSARHKQVLTFRVKLVVEV